MSESDLLPYACVAEDVRLGERVHLSPFVNVPAHALVAGHPARQRSLFEQSHGRCAS